MINTRIVREIYQKSTDKYREWFHLENGVLAKKDFWGKVLFPNETAEIPGTAGVKIPSGTTAERPLIADDGTIRYNSENGQVEVANNSDWSAITTLDISSPKKFGAKGDGITDDTESLENALNQGGTIKCTNEIFLISEPIDISGAKDVEFGNNSKIKLSFQDQGVGLGAINISDISDSTITINVEGTDVNPSGVRDCIRIKNAVGCKFKFNVKNSHDVAVRLIDCDDCDVDVNAEFTSFRGYALITDGCNNCRILVRGKHTNMGYLCTGPYLDGGQSSSTRPIDTYHGGIVAQAFIDDHESMGVDLNGSINTTIVNSVISNFAETTYNNFGVDLYASYQVKGGYVTRGHKFINCTAINAAIGFAFVGSGSAEIHNGFVDGAYWSPVLLTTNSRDVVVKGLRAIDWGKNPKSLTGYAGLTFAPMIQVTLASNCKFDNINGEVLTNASKKIAAIGVVGGNYNIFDNIGLTCLNSTPELMYGIYDSGAFSTYGENCAGIFHPTQGGVTKTFITKPVSITNLANATLPVISSVVIDSTDTAKQAFLPVKKARILVGASFTQTRAFGSTAPGTIIIGHRTDNDAFLTSTAVPSSAYLNMQFVELIQLGSSTGIDYTYTKGVDTDGQFVLTLYGFPL